jgi:predicted ATPase
VKGLEVARRQSAGSWELRVATSLAKLRDRQGRSHEAKTLLSGAYGKFTQGSETSDLLQARSLLESWSAF